MDARPTPEQRELRDAAARIAKIYCARAARTVGETSAQVHGGI